MPSLSHCKILFTWPAVGWIEGEVVKRNFNRRMEIGSGTVNFIVFYKHDYDDTSKHGAQSEQLQHPTIKMGLLTLLGTPGGGKGMRVEWTEFTWIFIAYVLVIFYLHTS